MPGLFSTPNDRMFYACQAVLTKSRQTISSGGADTPESNSSVLKGVQAVGVNRTIEKSQYLDVGRIHQEYGSYGKPSYEITVSRYLDKNEDFFFNVSGQSVYTDAHILNATNGIGPGFTGLSLRNYDISLLYGEDSAAYVGAGSIVQSTTYRCCLLNSISYTIPVSGPITEDLSFTSHFYTQNDETDPTLWTGLDFTHSGNTLTRRDISTNNCTFPLEITRMFDLSTSKEGIPILGLQQINVNINIAYNDLSDIGSWRHTASSDSDNNETNFFKIVQLPIEVTCDFTGIVRAQYFTEETRDFDITDTLYSAADGSESAGTDVYKSDRQIIIAADAGDGTNYFQWNLGSKNYLSDMSFSGGDAGGGNAEGTASFANQHSEIFLLKDSVIQEFSNSSIY